MEWEVKMKHKIVLGNEIVSIIENNYKGVNEVYICSPYLSFIVIKRILDILKEKTTINLFVITKYEPLDFILGSSEIKALDYIFSKTIYGKWKIKVFIVNNLHAKVILLGTQAAVLGSANITYSGLNKNREMGIAIFGEDSKILTIRYRLKGFIESGYELTKEQFYWYKKYDIPRYEKRAIGIKNLIKIIRIENEAGLQSFVPGDKKEKVIDYYNGVLNILDYLRDEKIVSKEKIIEWLISKSPKAGQSINEIRLSLLFNLGLIFENQKGIQLTGIGYQIAKTKSKEEFYIRLLGLFHEFEQIENYLNDHKDVHPKLLAKEKDLAGKKGEYWAIRLKWLESLDRVKSYYIGKQKYYSHFNKKEDVV